MPIVVVFDFPGEDTAKYHKVFELGGPAVNAQPDRLHHLCYQTDNGFTVIDIWQDEASFTAFGSVIGPALARAGLNPSRPSTRSWPPWERTAITSSTDDPAGTPELMPDTGEDPPPQPSSPHTRRPAPTAPATRRRLTGTRRLAVVASESGRYARPHAISRFCRSDSLPASRVIYGSITACPGSLKNRQNRSVRGCRTVTSAPRRWNPVPECGIGTTAGCECPKGTDGSGSRSRPAPSR